MNIKEQIKEILETESDGWEVQADQILDLIVNIIDDCKPLYLEGESKDFTEGQEYTIRQIKNKLKL